MKITKVKRIVTILSLFILIVGVFAYKWENQNGRSAENLLGNKKDEWKLFWSDEFDGDKLDLTKWDYQIGTGYNGWGNNEEQYYTKDNVSVANGSLIIEAKKEKVGKKSYSSGRIATKSMNGNVLFSTTCGKFEARIKLPAGSGLWPAFWMLPTEDAYGKWPLSGEIDIMEARGRIINQMQGAIHYGEVAPNNKSSHELYTFPKDTNITDYHIYSVEWDTNNITWYIDNKEYYSEKNWYTTPEDKSKNYSYPAPFNRPFYLILNLAVGGTFDEGIIPDSSNLPGKMEVDYVRVYKKSGESEEPLVYSKNTEETPNNKDNTQTKNDVSSTSIISPLDIKFFNKGNDKWTAYKTNVSFKKIDSKSVCNIEAKPSDNASDSMLIYNNIFMDKDITYELNFRAKSSVENQLFMTKIEDSEYVAGFEKEFIAGTEWKEYKFQFKIQRNSPLALKYMLGAVAKEGSLYLSDVSIKIVK